MVAARRANAEMLTLVQWLVRSWVTGDLDGAIERMERLAEDHPDLAVHLSSAGGFAMSYSLAGRSAEARAILDRCAALGVGALPFDAEWLPNVVSLLDAAVREDHPMVRMLVDAMQPYARLVAFEGIGAGIHGPVARPLAAACTELGRHDEAVAYARDALEIATRGGRLLTADTLQTLANCLDARDGGGDRDEARELSERADALYRAMGLASRFAARDTANVAEVAPGPDGNELRRDGDVWHVCFGGFPIIVKHTKGMADLAVLLASPGREFHVSELETVPRAALSGDGGEAIDRTAVAAYRDRLAELTEEIDDADAANDVVRAERARTEYDALVDELTRSLGLGGRARAAGAEPVERLRKAVSARVRDAIRRIDGFHPELGRHLSHSVRTGVFCSYQPEASVTWRCQT